MSSVPPGPPQGPPYMPPQGGPPPQYPPQFPQQYPPQAQPPKKSNALMWILIAVGVIVCLGVGAISIGSYLVYRTVKNVGFDPELMQKNPGLALTKLVATLHPDTQVVSTDDANGTVTVRDKTTGKLLTFRWDPDKKSLVIVGDDGKEVKFSASGDDKNGAVTVETGDGTLKFGAGAGNNTPAWAPVYPGTTPQGGFSSQTPDGSQNTYGFKTRDPASKVLDYFKQQLTSAGFKVNIVTATDQGGMLQANDEPGKRTVMVTATSSGEGTDGSVTTVEKK